VCHQLVTPRRGCLSLGRRRWRCPGAFSAGAHPRISRRSSPIENNSLPGQALYEPLSGSGTTIIAAEMTGRVAHAIEIASDRPPITSSGADAITLCRRADWVDAAVIPGALPCNREFRAEYEGRADL
jgi:hypothetical protein